jgi:hypothetical protein
LLSLLVVLALVLAFVPTAIAAQDEQVNLEGSVVSGDVLQLVFYSSAAQTPSVENIAVEIEGKPVALKSVNPISYADPGTSYIFLFDTNTAVTERALPDMKTIARTVIDKMGVQDHALIAPLGAEIDEKNFTDVSEKLSAQIDDLQAGKEPQDLYSSMYDALKLLSESSSLRARKCLVVIADGLDGQISGISEMELANLVEKAQIPVYVVALTYNTKTEARIEAAKTVTSFARMSPGGLSILLTPGGAEDAASQILAQREKTYLAVVAADAARAATSAEQASVKLSMTTENGVLSSTRTISLASLAGVAPSAQPTTEPTAGQTQQTPVPVSPTPAVNESFILPVLPLWTYITAGVVVLCVIALIVVLSVLKKRRMKKEGMVVRFDTDGGKQANADGPEICLIQLGEVEQLCCEMHMPKRLVIGGDKKRAQIPLADNPTIAPAQCRLIWKNGSVWVEELSKHQRTELNGVPIGQLTPVKTGDVLRLGSFEYRVFWEKR